jgi:hypothetical protein
MAVPWIYVPVRVGSTVLAAGAVAAGLWFAIAAVSGWAVVVVGVGGGTAGVVFVGHAFVALEADLYRFWRDVPDPPAYTPV